MIYLVTANIELFERDKYKVITVEESLRLMQDWKVVQFDTETEGVDAHISPVLSAQFGNKKDDIQIVVDTNTIALKQYKDVLESKLVIGQNLYFDLQFLYSHGIIPLKVYDTMIVEQLLYLGYPSVLKGGPGMSLKAIAERRLGVYIDKTVRGQIIWRGLDASVIEYGAGDVVYLEDIMWSQIKDCKERECINAAKMECDFVPVLAYVSWCGIKLDETLWKQKMAQDEAALDTTVDQLNQFVLTLNNPKFIYTERQGDLFLGYDTTPKSRVLLVEVFFKDIENKKTKIYSKRLLEEIKTFSWQENGIQRSKKFNINQRVIRNLIKFGRCTNPKVAKYKKAKRRENKLYDNN